MWVPPPRNWRVDEHEEWRPVLGAEGMYEVSDHGRVRSLDRVIMRSNARPLRCPGMVLTSWLNDNGYPTVSATVDGKNRPTAVHGLVAAAFLGPRPPGMEVCHGDGVKTNSHVSNLRYGTRSDNIRDSIRHGTHRNAAQTHCSRGHLLAEPNLYTWRGQPPSSRPCWACRRANSEVNHAATRGRVLDIDEIADWHYARITGVEVDRGPNTWRELPTHCRKCGHAYDEGNLKIRSDGARLCLSCLRKYQREWHRRKRAANAA